MGFKKGAEEVLNGVDANGKNISKEVFWWLEYGGEQEDRPGNWYDYLLGKPTRSVHHFHNPLNSWDNAGLNDYVLGKNYRGQSSVLWGQNINQDPYQNLGGKWSWQDAREYFYIALTGRNFTGVEVAKTKSEREKYFADTFRAVGQLMHLVHDASVAMHARNDIHILFSYEGWVEELRNREPGTFNTWLGNAKSYDKSILNLPRNSLSSIPIARIIDTDKYTGTNPDITTSKAIGMAEYSNANFLSEDTAFTNFPYPNWESVEKTDYSITDPRDSSKTVLRQYYKKVKDGS